MYLSNGLILNSGPISQFILTAPFQQNGIPKPIILVGTNGSGKTGVLSIIGDALIEIAAQKFRNITPHEGQGRTYFRMLGTRNQRIDSTFELSALRFVDGADEIYYRSKTGNLAPSSPSLDMRQFGPVGTWPETGNEKVIVGPDENIERIYNEGVYAFFPSTRFELPHWVNAAILDRDPEADFSVGLSHRLRKPIVVQSAIHALKPWILDLLLDQSVDAMQVLQSTDLNALKAIAVQKAPLYQTYANLNTIIQTILGNSALRIARIHRAHQDRRICIASNDKLEIPSLDHLSAGQATLLAIFGTMVRYGDIGALSRPLDQLVGTVIIDEIDAHLHADLQYRALPSLIKLFPRVQFIVSSHAPLFVLGMRKEFEDTGFALIEMPSGLTIDAERFSEFESSLAYFQATRAFETAIQNKFAASQRPLVLCEGETDPSYLKTAAELLEFKDIANQVEFDWVGAPAVQGAQGGGKSHLDDALKFLKNNPQFQTRSIVLLYDSDARKAAEDAGTLYVRSLPQIVEGRRKNGIENLLPNEVFEERFFEQKMMGKGDDRGPVPVLNKAALCDFLCGQDRNPSHFEGFRGPLKELQRLLIPQVN